MAKELFIEDWNGEFSILAQNAVDGQGATGYVDFYGYSVAAGGWCFVGWIAGDQHIIHEVKRVELHSPQPIKSDNFEFYTFERNDINNAVAIGFLVFVPCLAPALPPLRSLTVTIRDKALYLETLEGGHLPDEGSLAERLSFLSFFSTGHISNFSKWLRSVAEVNTPLASAAGYIDYFGYHNDADGVFVVGWVDGAWSDQEAPDFVHVLTKNCERRSRCLSSKYVRRDLPEGCAGFILFLPDESESIDGLDAVSFRVGVKNYQLRVSNEVLNLSDGELNQRVSGDFACMQIGPMSDRFHNVLARRAYGGQDTMDLLAPEAFLYVDHAYRCGEDGLLIVGWLLSHSESIEKIKVSDGKKCFELDQTTFVRISRHDVLEGYSKHGFDDQNCGFMTYVAGMNVTSANIHIEVQTRTHKSGYRSVSPSNHSGMLAIKEILASVEVRFSDIVPSFERVLGPAIDALNMERLKKPRTLEVVEYGVVPQDAKYSVLVPLYGRLDFVEYQLGLASREVYLADIEYVFVLDDPPKKNQAQRLFESIYQRFRIPFRAVFLEKNLGFAPANNVGLSFCNGKYLVYLNSDVFPGTPDWLDKLARRLEADPTLGVVGPQLLFEDGAIQHRGMFFEKLPEYGNWWFCQHLEKGMRYKGSGGMQYFIAITGACMMMDKELAVKLGGFDEGFAIGDFEDSDLCLKLQKLGYRCGVDNDVFLYHLERKSQVPGSINWRSNLTAFNAWKHQNRWGEYIASLQESDYRFS